MRGILLGSLAAAALFGMAVSDADAAGSRHHPKARHYGKTWTYQHQEWGYARERGYRRQHIYYYRCNCEPDYSDRKVNGWWVT